MAEVAIGALRSRVTLLQPTATKDTIGGQTVTYTPERVVWAEVLDRPSREVLQAGAMLSGQGRTCRIRFLSGLAVGWRVQLSSGVVCDVSGIRDPHGRRRWLEIDLVDVPGGAA